MAFIICGYGFFKTNISCLLGQLYSENNNDRDSAFILLYLGGNIGGIIAPIIVGYISYYYGWHAGFSVAGVGMLLGFIIYITGSRYIPDNSCKNIFTQKSIFKGFIVFSSIVFVLVTSYILLTKMIVGYIISIVTLTTLCILTYIWVKGSKELKGNLNFIFLLMLFAVVFWIFDQQTGSSIVTFIARNVNRNIFGVSIPASVFSAINPLAVLIGGVLVAFIFSKCKAQNRIIDMVKFFIGLLMLTLSFLLLYLGAKMASLSGHSSAVWVIIGLTVLGFAELFIDPLALSQITSMNSSNTGFIAASYMLFSGSVANYLAAKIADLSSSNMVANQVLSPIDQAKLYEHLFYNILIFTIFICAFWVLCCLLMNKKIIFKERGMKLVK